MKKILGLLLLASCFAYAEKASVKVEEVPTSQDTSIVIKKGTLTQDCTEYEILDGKDEIAGDLNYARGGAMTAWKQACKEWKTSMKEMNKDNQILSLNCNSPTADKDGDQFVYKSNGTYKMKVKIREKKQ